MGFLVRFFHAVPPVPPLMQLTAGVVVLLTGLVIVVDPSRTVRALQPLLLLQLFAAASGFAGAARRGHYDLLFTRGEHRTRIALVHWAMSVAPGLAGWLALAEVEWLVLGAPGAAWTGGTLAALAAVSTIPWAVTVPLPRFAGAIGWLLLLGLVTVVTPLSSLPPPVEATLYPAGLVGRTLSRGDLALVLPGVVLSVCAMTVACLWIHRMNVPLEAAQ